MPKETGKTKNVCEESLRPDSVACDRAYIIVGLAGEEVDVENVPGGGCQFTVTLFEKTR